MVSSIGERSFVKLGTAISVALAACTFAVWFNVRLSSIDYKLAELSSASMGHWSYRDMIQWTRLFKEMNQGSLPALRIPEVDDRR